MIYGNELGDIFSKANSGIGLEVTSPAQMGYSINQPLARVRKQSLDGSVNINALNRVDANDLASPATTLGSLTSFSSTASQFASDLASEANTFLTGQTISNVPNYYLVGGGLALLLIYKLGQGRKGKRRR